VVPPNDVSTTIMKILVTGAAGFIGSHIVDNLLCRGDSVIGVDSFDAFYAREVKERNLEEARSHDSFRMLEGDVRDEIFLAALPPDIDAIIHLAARAGVRPSISDPVLYTDVNVMGTIRLLELARERSVGTFVFASSSSVYGNNAKVPFSEDDPVDRPISPYAATKKAGELLCHTATHLHGLATICLRFFTAYGPRQRPDLAIHKFARLLRSGERIPMFGDGTSCRDYTFIDDISDGVLAALDRTAAHPGTHEVVNLGESRTVALKEMVATLADEMDLTPDIELLPPQPGDVERTFADVSKARSLFGYEPKTEFRVGVRAFLEWLERQPRS
jgi:UDP-glucuronate 4-epimerase